MVIFYPVWVFSHLIDLSILLEVKIIISAYLHYAARQMPQYS